MLGVDNMKITIKKQHDASAFVYQKFKIAEIKVITGKIKMQTASRYAAKLNVFAVYNVELLHDLSFCECCICKELSLTWAALLKP